MEQKNCCDIRLLSIDQKQIEFECEAHCHEGLCKYQGKWSYYGGGTCSKASCGDSVGCWCNDPEAQIDAMRRLIERLNRNILETQSKGAKK